MAKNNFANAVNVVLKQAHANSTRCILVWATLALREEGFGRKRIKRVLDSIHKYANTLNNKNTIENQLQHIEKTLGLRIVWRNDDEITIEEIEEMEGFEDEAEE